jgi:hypothetical protein
MAIETKKETKEIEEEEIKIPDAEVIDAPPEGYTQGEWDRLSTEDKEGIRDMIKNPDGEEETVDEDVLKEIAGIVPEVKPDEIKPEVIPEPEVKKVEEIKPEIKPEEEVSDTDLLGFRTTATSADMNTWLATQPKEVQEKYVVSIPSDMLSKHNESLKGLKDKFDNDEISKDDYEDKRDELKEKLSDFKATERERIRDALRDDFIWDSEQRTFWKARKEYLGEINAEGKIIKSTKSMMLMSALQSAINQINDTGLSGMQVLVKADKLVKETLGLVKPKEVKVIEEIEPKKKSDADIAKEKGVAKLPDETLGDVPDAGKNSVEDGWAAVDRMPDAKREAWLKKQPQNVVDAYVNSLSRGK